MDQTTVLRKLSGEQRVVQALKLSDFVRDLARLGKQDRAAYHGQKKSSKHN